MAIDANIPLQIKLPDFAESYAKGLDIRNNRALMQQKNALAQLQMQELQQKNAASQRDIERRNALSRGIAASYSPSGIDIDKVSNYMVNQGFAADVPEIQKQLYETQSARTGQKKSEQDLYSEKLSYFRNLLPTVRDEGSYQTWRTSAIRSMPYMEEFLPEAYSPQGVQQLMMTADQELNNLKQLDRNGTIDFINPRTGEVVSTFEKGQTPAQRQQAQTDERRIALEQRRIALQEREQDPVFQQAKAAAQEEGKLAARDVTTAINTIPKVLEEAGQGISILTKMIGERDAKGNLLPGSKPHPGFANAVGAISLDPRQLGYAAKFIGGTDTSDFVALYNQVLGQAFLQAFERLKGAGQITVEEGKKATEAITSLSLAQSEKEFVKAAMDLQDMIDRYSERAVSRYNKLTAGRDDVAPITYVPLGREGRGADRARRLDELFGGGS